MGIVQIPEARRIFPFMSVLENLLVASHTKEAKKKRKEVGRKNVAYLNEHLSQIAGVEILKEDSNITSNSCHIYIWRYKKEHFNNVPKEKFIDALRKEGFIVSAGYSIPLTIQPVFKNLAFGAKGRKVDVGVDYSKFSLPETEKACYDEAIWFPQFVLLGDDEDMKDIVNGINKIKENIDELAE